MGILCLYLFIIFFEGLTSLIHQAEARGNLPGVKICRGAPTITHLLFAADCFLFSRVNPKEIFYMKTILDTYEKASGPQVNFQKSKIFFSKNVSSGGKDNLVGVLGVNTCLGTGRHLGLPSMVGRSKKALFKFIKDRV